MVIKKNQLDSQWIPQKNRSTSIKNIKKNNNYTMLKKLGKTKFIQIICSNTILIDNKNKSKKYKIIEKKSIISNKKSTVDKPILNNNKNLPKCIKWVNNNSNNNPKIPGVNGVINQIKTNILIKINKIYNNTNLNNNNNSNNRIKSIPTLMKL